MRRKSYLSILCFLFYMFVVFSSGMLLSFEENIIKPVDSWFTEKDEVQILGTINDIIVLDSTVFAVNGKSRKLLMIQNGKIIKEIGRKGQGPQEYIIIPCFYKINDSIYLIDIVNKKIDVYSLKGNFQKSINIRNIHTINKFVLTEDKKIVSGTDGFRSKYLIHIMDLNGKILKQFGKIEAPSFDVYIPEVSKREILKGKIPSRRKNNVLIHVLKDKSIFAAHQALNLIKKFDSQGRLIFEIKINDKSFEKIFENAKEMNKQARLNAWYPLSYWSDIVSDDLDNIYLLMNHPDKTKIIKLDKKGNIIKKYKNKNIVLSKIYLKDNILWGFDHECALYKFKIEN